jgi:hypothetical protein
MPFSVRAMRFIRAYAEGVAEMRMRGSEDMVVVVVVVCVWDIVYGFCLEGWGIYVQSSDIDVRYLGKR